jgi:transaldolase/glucose-6-phosphate isomerase
MSERSGELRLGRDAEAVERRLRRWRDERFGERLWAKDHTLWSAEPVPELTDRLGWLELPASMAGEVDALERFAREAAEEGIRHAVVLGMGGSSLAPEVYARTFGAVDGYPALEVLDSTHPGAVRDMAARLDVSRSLFLVSSKSGTTTETLSFFRFFWERAGAAGEAGRHFAAITDPGTPLEKLARERGFRAVFNAPPDVGGRYSALTPFGLVPAALLGADLRALLGSGRSMAEACGPEASAAGSPGLLLGAALGELTLAGRDKVTFVTSPSLSSFPAWLEQLIAESTGKTGRGIVPVAGEPLGEPGVYGGDRFFAVLLLEGDEEGEIEERLAALEGAGHPVAVFRLGHKADLGAEMFRWEVAVAAAGAVLGLNPFDQPDVQLAKELATRAMKDRSQGAATASDSDEVMAEALGDSLEDWLAGAGRGSYVGIHAYLPPRPGTDEALNRLQAGLRDRTRCATTLGHGPRFLHSTGQLHKGGPDTGRFLQIVDEPAEDLAVPETDYTFGTLIRAQADGDRAALRQRGRRVLRVQLGRDAQAGLDALLRAVERRQP